ncbi:MAG: hypothetical protein DRQ44_02540 [Gammaproteobacteria bacterium]|nr:MAG: hypothetical protein DRQ44_02540 [Gammaproteobacteria bacterium]
MFKVSKFFLPLFALSFLIGCSGSDSPEEILEDILNKDSVTLGSLDSHSVTYENATGGVQHTDIYCPNGMLGDKVGVDGTWLVTGNDLTVSDTTANTAFTHQTTTATLVKNASYPTTTGETFKVTKIAETICL